jgi:NAD-dependent SIR2 family protein deacetylase
MNNNIEKFKLASEKIYSAEIIVITAGAGIGVDSGLPDFRGNTGFWKAYPMYEKLGLSFIDAANPVHFENDPEFGWGFYGHRLNLYRETIPHKGFAIILDWCKSKNISYFVVTSNVDGQFQKAGYNPNFIYEIHGSIHHLQCLTPCTNDIWKNEEIIEVDYESMRAKNVPMCKNCDSVARPNILMFGDYSWLPYRTHRQSERFNEFLTKNKDKNIVVIEMGAGTAIPSIRHTSEEIGKYYNATVIRINPRESFIRGEMNISIPLGSLAALEAIDGLLF